MRVQGWELQANTASCAGFVVQSGSAGKKQEKTALPDTGRITHPDDTSRTTLISLIKDRIKSGFYNSEAVIDDLGHGFAQALDQTL